MDLDFLLVYSKITEIDFYISIHCSVMPENIELKQALKDAKNFQLNVLNYLNEKYPSIHFSEQKVTIKKIINKKGNIKELEYKFDYVSADKKFMGDAKFLKNIPEPAAKYDNISKYVWLLQNSDAQIKFLIFGRDKEVPERYLKRFEPLIKDVEFYFFNNESLVPLGDNNDVKLLTK